MAKQVKNTDVVQKDLFKDSRESAESLLFVLEKIQEEFKTLGKDAKKAISELDFSKKKDIVEFEKITSDLVESTDQLSNVQKEKLKIDKQLSKEEKAIKKIREDNAKSTEENRVELQKLRIETARVNKEAKEQAKVALSLTNEYDRQKAELAKLTKSLINLRLEGKGNTETFRDQEKQFKELFESVSAAEQEFGRFQRQVGDYEKAAEAASKATAKLSRGLGRIQGGAIAVGGILAGGGLVGRALKSTQDGFDELGAISAGASTGVDTLLASLLESIKASNQQAEAGAGVTKQISAFFATLGEGVEKTKESVRAQKELFKIQQEFGKVIFGLKEGFEETSDAAKDLITNFANAFGVQVDSSRLKTISDSLAEIASGADISNKALAEQVAIFERNSAAADQNTRSLTERSVLARSAAQEAEKALDIEEKQIKARLVLAKEQEKILRDAGLKTLEAAQSRSDAEVELAGFESRRNQQRIENAERLNQILQDQAELELDILIDSFDNQKTINERIIADSSKTLEQRNALLDETSKRFEQSFEDQIRVIEELEKTQQAVQTLTEEGTQITDENIEAEIKSAESKGELIDLNKTLGDIINKSASEQVDEITALNLSEIVQTRLLEVLRERRTATQDLTEAQRDLKEEQLDINEIEADVVLQQEALNKIFKDRADLEEALEELEKARLETEIDNLAKRIEERKKAGEETIELEQKFNQKLIELAKQNANEEKEILAQAKQATIDSIDVVSQAFTSASNNRLRQIDTEIDKIQEREQALRRAAENGTQIAKDNLAFNQRQQAELERAREEQVKKAQRREIVLAGLKAFAENAGQPNAVAKTLSDVTTLSAGLLALVPNFHGSDDTGNEGPFSDQYGTVTGIVHDNEMVLSKKDRGDIGFDKTRADIKEAIQFQEMHRFDKTPVVQVQRFESNAAILQKFDELKKEVASMPDRMPRVLEESFDEKSKVYKTVIKTGNKVEKNHKKIGGIWG